MSGFKILKIGFLVLGCLLMLIVPFIDAFGVLILWGIIYMLLIMNIIDTAFDKVPENKPYLQPIMQQAIPEKVEPQPIKVEKPKTKFICKYCQKEMETEKKLRRHIGMAHYDQLAI